MLLANDMARKAGGPGKTVGQVTTATFAAAVQDYLPSRDTNMLHYMELLAVFESSRRSMLPARYKNLSGDELSERLREHRLRLHR